MKLLVYGINYPPELTGIGKYTGEMASWLASRGHEVRVVTAPPYYPDWKVQEGYSVWSYKRENLSGVSVWRCPVYVPADPTALKRIIHLASFALSSFPVLASQIFWKPDVILVIEPPLFCAPATLLISWLSNAKSWLHIQDFEVDAAFDLGMLSAAWLRKIVLDTESKLMGMFDLISTISDRMIDKLKLKGIGNDKVTLFPNWVNISEIYPLDRSSGYRKELGIPESAFVALYSGNMGEKQGLGIVLEAARCLINHKNIVFVMCGQGAARVRLKKTAEGLDNIYWLPLQPLESLNKLLNLADVHLLPQRAGVKDLVMPSKLTGMLASGRPVIATTDPDSQVAEILERCGVIVPHDDVEQFSNALLDLLENPTSRNLLGERARAYAVANMSNGAILNNLTIFMKEHFDQ